MKTSELGEAPEMAWVGRQGFDFKTMGGVEGFGKAGQERRRQIKKKFKSSFDEEEERSCLRGRKVLATKVLGPWEKKRARARGQGLV